MILDQTHFNIVAKCIELLTATGGRASLESLGNHVGMSPFHLQRLFVEWAGVSPQEFGQSLQADRAKQLLSTQSVADTSVDLGLTSSSRLHDLLLRVDAMTPGEYKREGSGLEIRWGVFDTPFGEALFATTHRGICRIAFDSANPDGDLATAWPKSKILHQPDAVAEAAGEVIHRMEGHAPSHRLGILMRGSPLRLQVWRALMDVPPGRLVSYASAAQLAEHPTAIRAAATCVAQNEIAFLIPCHRVIRANGQLGKYRWGTSRKAAMLSQEQRHCA